MSSGLKIDLTTLKQRQSLPLEAKVNMTKSRIISFVTQLNGDVAISFSGGLDSTVLLDIARELFPNLVAVFVNTGLEYPEVVRFVKSQDNVIILRPKMNFKTVLETYGFPVVSKRVSEQIRTLRNPTPNNVALRHRYLTGKNKKGIYRYQWKLAEKWKFLLEAPFRISEQCCDIMKKAPYAKYAKETGNSVILGTRASESQERKLVYMKYGCNSYGKHGKSRSRPLSFWLHRDVLEYIATRQLEYPSIYGQLRQDLAQEYYNTGLQGSGCIFCCFGLHLESQPNRFQRLRKSHPRLYKYCMTKLGLDEVLNFMRLPH